MCSFNWSYLHHFGTVENFSTAKETDSPAAAWWWVNQAGGRRPKKRSLTVDCCQVMQGGPLVVINGIITPIWVFPKIGGKPPKWMVKIMENPIKMGWFGGTTIFGNIHIGLIKWVWLGVFHPTNIGVLCTPFIHDRFWGPPIVVWPFLPRFFLVSSTKVASSFSSFAFPLKRTWWKEVPGVYPP